MPIVLRAGVPPTPAFLAGLEAAGAKLARRSSGEPVVRGGIIAATVTRDALARVAALPGVLRVELDGQLFPAPRPLDHTSALIAAHEVGEASSPALPGSPSAPGGEPGLGITGAGVTVCDLDTGIDPFHPMMFRADGGYYAWVDVDGDGVFDPGVDAVELGAGNLVTLRTLDVPITAYWSDDPIQGSGHPSFALGLDYLYADVNLSGAREKGPAAGFTESDVTYGEPLFVADDVDGDGLLEPGEKIVALGTSKIRAFRLGGAIFRRGENLIETPVDPEFAHGMGATGIIAGGQPGFSRLVGVAPGAEIIMATGVEQASEFVMTDFCIDEGARVVLHEYAPWMGYHLDGSSMMEQTIDKTAEEGIAHINPAGNLSTSQKLYKRTIAAGSTTTIPIDVSEASPYAPFRLVGLSVLWREPGRSLDLTLTDPAGNTSALTEHTGVLQVPFGDHYLYAYRDDSSRGTVRVDAYVYGDAPIGLPPPLEHGTWTLDVVDPLAPGGADLELIAYVLDDVSGWGKGIHFPEDASEDHLIGYPGTADLGLAVAAYTGHGFFSEATPGERAPYSGRGRRIDGTHILSISAPDDPITSGVQSEHPVSYVVYGGTSGASPHVAGTAALLLSAEPELDGIQVRERIRFAAAVDASVGAVPNEDYGYGKLRSYETVFGESPAGGESPTIAIAPVESTPGEKATVMIEVADADEPASDLAIDVDRDYDGTYDERLAGPSFEVTSATVGEQALSVRVVDSTGKTARALAWVSFKEGELPPEEVAPPSDEAPLEDDGCGCRVAGNGDTWPSSLLALAWGLRLLRLRARARRNSKAMS